VWGFVSAVLPETAYACWRQIRFDNARAHLAADSLNVACELLGCAVDVGPAYQPDERPFIERFFGTVAARFSHRLPGTTGSDPDDLLRKLKDPHGDLRLVVSLEELRELLAVWIWNYNGTPHGGLGSARTPLEAMSAAIRGRRTLLRHLPLSLRGNICLLQSVHPARVRGNINRGEKPHISFYHVRYTSHRLARSPELISKTLRIYYSADDIRILRAFLADGTELDEFEGGRHLVHDPAFSRFAPENLPRQAITPTAFWGFGRSGAGVPAIQARKVKALSAGGERNCADQRHD
jgi:putative transposase